MYNKIGFIGCGKMASAIIKGLLNSKFIDADNIIATQAKTESIEEKSKALGINIITDNKYLVKNVDVIFLATKPSQIDDVLKEIESFIDENKLIISIAAGKTISSIKNMFKNNTRIVRVMPNTPALIGEGMSGIIGGEFATNEDVLFVYNLFNTIGKSIIIDNEDLMDAVTAISGSGPAFYYKVINDIARAGEKLGMKYADALLLSTQTAIGSAKMALHSNISMEDLISNVATKGGCTKVGIDIMNEINTEKIFFDVISATEKKANELGRNNISYNKK